MAAVIVYHEGYGCDTGCCGHRVELTEDSGRVREEFSFDHPYDARGDRMAWARELVRETFGEEHVADLDWSECLVLDD